MTWTISGFADEAGASISEQIDALTLSGLKHIDIRSVDGYNIVDLPLEHARVVKVELDGAGIAVQMFGSPIGKIDIDDNFEIDLSRLRHLAQLAPILGCNAVRIFSYYNKADRPHEDWKELSLDRLLTLKRSAEDLGLVLYHENERHIFGDKATDVAAIGKFIRDGKSFKTIFDFDNYTQGGESAWDAWNLVKSQVDAIHLKDSAGFQHVPVGLGDGHVEDILRDAVAKGWKGPLSVEPHLSHSGATAATGPSGVENQTYAAMSHSEQFVLAAKTAINLLHKVGADFV